MWKQQRRKKLQSAPFPAGWRRILEARVPFHTWLPEPDRRELEGLIQVFLTEKNFEGCGGLVITEEIKLCIAAQACLLLLHRNTDYYPGLRSVLVYPGTYFVSTSRHLGAGVIEETMQARLGEAWQHGTVVLAWDAVRHGASDAGLGPNIVLHEFAHLLDYEDGRSDGAPLLDIEESRAARKSRYASWARVLGSEFEQLRAKVQNGDEVVLDAYGATNPAEFFAVATESFFTFPHEMQVHHLELYEQLKGFYRQDPVLWTPFSQESDTVRACIIRGNAKKAKGDLDGALADYAKAIELNLAHAGSYGYRGDARRAKGDLAGALADYTKAIDLQPDSADAYYTRGQVKREAGDLNGALADYTKAIELEPDSAHSFYARGIVKAAAHDLDGAMTDYNKAIELNPDYFNVYYARGIVKRESSDLDGALADYSKAISLNPNYFMAYHGRGLAKQSKDDFDGALADYDKAIELNPKHAGPYFSRGCLHYNLRQFTDALLDFRNGCGLNPISDYGHFRICLSRARLGEKEAATQELRAYLENRKTGKPDDWESQIARFLAGQFTEPDFFKAAESADQKQNARQRCQAYFYAGTNRLIDGDSTTAAELFERCVATRTNTFAEYRSAVAELKSLRAAISTP